MNSVKIALPLLLKRSALKGKNLLSSRFFNSGDDPFSEGLCMLEYRLEVTKVVFFVRMAENQPGVSSVLNNVPQHSMSTSFLNLKD